MVSLTIDHPSQLIEESGVKLHLLQREHIEYIIHQSLELLHRSFNALNKSLHILKCIFQS